MKRKDLEKRDNNVVVQKMPEWQSNDSKPFLPMVLSGQGNLADNLKYRYSMPLASRVVGKCHHQFNNGKWRPGRMVIETSPDNYQVWIHASRSLFDDMPVSFRAGLFEYLLNVIKKNRG